VEAVIHAAGTHTGALPPHQEKQNTLGKKAARSCALRTAEHTGVVFQRRNQEQSKSPETHLGKKYNQD